MEIIPNISLLFHIFKNFATLLLVILLRFLSSADINPVDHLPDASGRYRARTGISDSHHNHNDGRHAGIDSDHHHGGHDTQQQLGRRIDCQREIRSDRSGNKGSEKVGDYQANSEDQYRRVVYGGVRSGRRNI